MDRIILLAVALAVLVAATGAAAAVPGSTTAADTGATEAGDTSEPAGGDAVGQAGPRDGLPEPVPDFVSEIHGLIDQFVDGTVDSLGSAVSDVAGGYQADSENADES
jgi:hypothetical protein